MMSLSWLILQPLAMSIVGPHIYVFRLGGWRPLRYIGVLLGGVAVRSAPRRSARSPSSTPCPETRD